VHRRLLIVVVLVVAGCAAPQEQKTRLITPFNYAEHDRYLSPTNATLRGQALLRSGNSGLVETCAGSQVLAVPATTFFREMMEIVKRGQQPQVANEVDPVYRSIIKVGQCDSRGNFVVTNMAPGTWIVTTEVSWSTGGSRQSVALMREVIVASGDTSQVLLTDADRVR
jgi:hypothetical protein